MSLLLWRQRSKEVWDGHATGLRSAPSGLSKRQCFLMAPTAQSCNVEIPAQAGMRAAPSCAILLKALRSGA